MDGAEGGIEACGLFDALVWGVLGGFLECGGGGGGVVGLPGGESGGEGGLCGLG